MRPALSATDDELASVVTVVMTKNSSGLGVDLAIPEPMVYNSPRFVDVS